MKSNTGVWVALIAVAIMSAAALMFSLKAPAPAAPTQFGGVTNYDSIQLTKVGTSTLTQVGCYQGYATSTATPIIYVYTASGTTTITGSPLSAIGVVGWQYGKCGKSPGL